MTTREADRLIRTGQVVTLRNDTYGEEFRAALVARDRYNVRTAAGGVYDRAELAVLADADAKMVS